MQHIDTGQMMQIVGWDDGQPRTYGVLVENESGLAYVCETAIHMIQRKLQVGDRVRLMWPSHITYGREGVVFKIAEAKECPVYYVRDKVTGRETCWVTRESLELIEGEVVEERQFQVGDWVEVALPYNSAHGTRGTVASTSHLPDGRVQVLSPTGAQWWLPSSLKHVRYAHKYPVGKRVLETGQHGGKDRIVTIKQHILNGEYLVENTYLADKGANLSYSYLPERMLRPIPPVPTVDDFEVGDNVFAMTPSGDPCRAKVTAIGETRLLLMGDDGEEFASLPGICKVSS